MAAYEVLLLNTAIPQIQAAQSGDTYVVPRDIAFSAALTLSAGTANGVPYLNGSKVLTTGSALTFDGTNLGVPRLLQSGSGTYGVFNSSGAGNAWASYQYASSEIGEIGQGSGIISGGSNTDFGIRATNNLVFAISYNELMRLTSTGLGIGETNPVYKLSVNSGASTTVSLFTSTGSSAFLGLVNSGASTFIGNDSTSGSFVIQTPSGSYSTKLTLDNSGNLGLGVTPKTDWNADYDAFQLGSGSSLSGHTSTSLNFTILASNQYVNTAGTAKFINDGYAPRYLQRGDTGEHYWYTTNSGLAGGNVTNTQAMTLDASGNLLVGYTSLWSSERLSVTGSSASQRFIYARTTSNGHYLSLGTNGTLPYIEYGNGAGLAFTDGATERARITSGGIFQVSSGGSVQVGGTAARATTAGTNRLDIFNGTAPVGTLADGISIYSAAGEAYVMDAAGNATLFSPHDAETNEWIFKSKHTPTGKVLKIDVERLLKFVNDHFGLDAVHEFVEE